MPRVGSYAAAPGQWAGNRSMLADIDEQDERSKQNDLREQTLQFREAHAQQMNELAQQAAQLHDQQITAKLADEKLLQDQKSQALDQYTRMTAELGNGTLKPNDPGYATNKAALMSRYPLAASMLDSERNSGAASVLNSFDKANESWMESQSKLRDQTVAIAKELGTAPIQGPDGMPDTKSMQQAAINARTAANPAAGMDAKSTVVTDPITGAKTTYENPNQPITPLQQAQRIQAEIASHQTGIAQAGTQLDKLQSENPWLKTTTGVYTDPKTGNQYMGNSLPTDTTNQADVNNAMKIATPANKALFQQQQDLISEQQAKMANLPKLQDQLSTVLSGAVAAPPPPAGGAATPPPAGDVPVANGRPITDFLPLKP
jgi:hypothetical protein